MASSKTHICFVVPFAYSLYNTASNHNFGGAEVRSSLFAKALAKREDFEVSVVVNNHGQPSVEEYDGLKVYRHTGYHDNSHWLTQYRSIIKDYLEVVPSFPYIKIVQLHPKTIKLVSSLVIHRLTQQMKAIIYPRKLVKLQGRVLPLDKYQVFDLVDADVYCVFGTKPQGGEVAAYCRARNKKFVLFGASDRNFTSLVLNDSLKDRDVNSVSIADFIVKQADLIIAQTAQQATLIEENFNCKAQIINNPIDLHDMKQSDGKSFALWVGRSHPEKNPQLLIDLARENPQISFIMIMNRAEEKLHKEIATQCPDNVNLIEHVPLAEIEQYFADAFVLVNTSPMEGFPNTFLQAGKYRTPILSYMVNPDSYLSQWNCGVVAKGHWATMQSLLQRLHHDSSWHKQLGDNHYEYVQMHHNLKGKVQQLAEYIRHLFN